MPQGITKPAPKSKTGPKPKHSTAARTKATKARSNNVTAPKDAKVAKLQKEARKSAAGLGSQLEVRLAERAGHTEMIAKQKRDRGASGKVGRALGASGKGGKGGGKRK